MRFSFTVDDETASRIMAFARSQRRSVGNLAVVAIEEYMARKEADRKRAARRRKGSLESLHVSQTENALVARGD